MKLRLVFLACAPGLLCLPPLAAAGFAFGAKPVEASLVAERTALVPGRTTTVALRLFDRADGKLLAQAQNWNAQAPYGADVISRIQHTMEASDGLGELSRCIRCNAGTSRQSACAACWPTACCSSAWCSANGAPA